MRFGICTGLDAALDALRAGFDYVEVGASRFATEDPFNPDAYRQVDVEVSHLFFPGSIRLFGEEATNWRNYAFNAISRASEIGIQTMVIGSGAARRHPEADDLAFARIAAEISELGRRQNIVIAPESLNRTETNVGNDLGSFARLLKDHGVAYTADAYHVLYEWNANGGEGAPSSSYWAEQLPFPPAHVHIADLARNVPYPEDPRLAGFVDRLRELGYDQRVSIEANVQATPDALDAAVRSLRKLFSR